MPKLKATDRKMGRLWPKSEPLLTNDSQKLPKLKKIAQAGYPVFKKEQSFF